MKSTEIINKLTHLLEEIEDPKFPENVFGDDRYPYLVGHIKATIKFIIAEGRGKS